MPCQRMAALSENAASTWWAAGNGANEKYLWLERYDIVM